MPEIWVFRPTGPPNSIESALQSACGIRDWAYKPHKTAPRSVRDRRDRDVRIHTINPQQATLLYVRLHRHPVGVIQLHETYVPKTPNPVRNLRDYIPLSQFVQYKSFFYTINPNEFDTQQAEKVLSAMENWIAEISDFSGESDPRCLPLHVFSAHHARYDLDAPDGRQRFKRDHGPQGSREDKNGLNWERDMHGREVLQIGVHPLLTGFHWDVTLGSRKSGSKTVSNTVAIWKIGRNGHVNIYPDAHVRKGQNCTKVYGS